MASKIVVKGHVTYAQAQKVAKAGNWESIKFDMRTQAISCAGAAAISGAIGFWNAKKQGLSNAEAAKEAAKAGAVSSATALGGGVLAQQALRTTAGRNAEAAATNAVKPFVESAIKTEVDKQILTKTVSVIPGKQVTQKAEVNVLTKTPRTNVVTSAAMFVATSIPDTIKECRAKMSGADYAENHASNSAGIEGGWGGASAGAAIDTAIFLGVGTIIGGLIGGYRWWHRSLICHAQSNLILLKESVTNNLGLTDGTVFRMFTSHLEYVLQHIFRTFALKFTIC